MGEGGIGALFTLPFPNRPLGTSSLIYHPPHVVERGGAAAAQSSCPHP